MKTVFHPAQLRAARALLNWSRGDLAAAAKTAERTIARLEAGETDPHASTTDAIRKVLEARGVVFIAQNGGGPGVRLRRKGKR